MNKDIFYEEDVIELRDGLTPYPEDIFVENQSWLDKYIQPLISIDLGLLRKDLKGTILHMVNPTEPYEGLIGELTTEFHNEYCSENWIAFELTKDNKYRFLGEENYFLSAPIHKDKVDNELNEHIKRTFEKYQKVKKLFEETGKLLPWQEDNPQSFLDELGGETWYGNWTETSPIPSAFKMDLSEITNEDLPNDGISITYKGKEFMFVAEVSGYNYSEGADAIMMFYEPESRIVLFTYDWT